MIIPKEEVLPTQEEFAAQQAESRRAMAEGQYVILLEDIKRVHAKIDQGDTTLNTQNHQIKERAKEIEKGEIEILNIQTKTREESEKLAETKRQREKEENDLAVFRINSISEKEKTSGEIESIKTSHVNLKINNEAELKKIEDAKNLFIEETKTIIANLESLKDEEANQITSTESVKIIHSNILLDIDKENDNIKNLKTISLDWNDTNEKKKNASEILDGDIKTKTASSLKLDDDIEQKGIELKNLESRAFAVVAREDALAQKEAFVKRQFERAAIPWTE